MSLRFRIVLSMACAVLGVVSCLAYAGTVRAEAEKVRSDAIERFGGEVAQLVVADQALEAGDVITERNVRTRDWVADLAPEGAVVSLQDVLGKEVRVPVSKGAPLTDLNFRDESTLAKVPSGHVAVSVPVTDKLGISRGVLRGARISAYAVSDDGPRLIASDVEVLSELTAGGSLSAQQITIAVLPEDVATILGASATGDLRLVIPADDVDVSDEQAEEVEPPVEMVPGEGVEA
ncbi:MAG: flagella basal body P-ring formation protein FlgA [Atopobiaceae bacterium]|nr:flagella basal body P-ring formation protein FlgA [Atopobiaceae bacterium]